MCGYPGSGKSTYLSQTQHLGIILCPDDFRLVLTGQTFYGPAEDSVWSHVKVAARVLLKNQYQHHVIIDATHLTQGSRKSWIKLANETQVDIHCWWQNVPVDVAIERNRSRKQDAVPDEVMDNMISSFVPPDIEEGFSRVVDICREN